MNTTIWCVFDDDFIGKKNRSTEGLRKGPYKEIKEKHGIAKGSVTNIVKELIRREIDVGVNKVEETREATKKIQDTGLELSQAIVVCEFLEKFQQLETEPREIPELIGITRE